MPSTTIAVKRSASSSVSRPGVEPRVRPVRRREHEQRRRAGIEVGAQPARLDPLLEERTPALLVAPPLGEDLLAVGVLEVSPLAREHRGDVELLGDDAKMAAQREPHALDRRQRAREPRRAPRGTRARPPASCRTAAPASSPSASRASPSGRRALRPGRPSTCRGSRARRRAARPRGSARPSSWAYTPC